VNGLPIRFIAHFPEHLDLKPSKSVSLQCGRNGDKNLLIAKTLSTQPSWGEDF